MKLKAFSLVFIVAALIPSLSSEVGVGQPRRNRHRSRSVVSTNESRGRAPSAEEVEKLAVHCALSNRQKPEAEVKGNAMLCGKAISLPKPHYPAEAQAAGVSGSVTVQVVIDEEGRMIWAKAGDGHPSLQEASVKAACRARVMPVKISGRAVKAEGAITYSFVSQ
jgi:TonB family protein